MTRTGAEADAYIRSQVGASIRAGYCLMYVENWFATPHTAPTANAAWNAVKGKHTDRPPTDAVVPVWFNSPNPAGHVAVHVIGGPVVTVNGTKVSIFASIDAVAAAGFGSYRGWGSDLEGQTLWTAPPPPPAPSGIILHIGSTGPHVVNFQTGMRRIFPAYAKESKVKRGQLITIDGIYGAQSAEWARLFQTKTGLDPDGVVGANTIPKLATYGVNV